MYSFSAIIYRFAERKKLLYIVGNPPGQLSPHIGEGIFKPQGQGPIKIFKGDCAWYDKSVVVGSTDNVHDNVRIQIAQGVGYSGPEV